VCWPVRTRTRLLERAIAPPSRLPVTAVTICTGGGRRPRNRSSRLYGFTQSRPAIAAAIAAAVVLLPSMGTIFVGLVPPVDLAFPSVAHSLAHRGIHRLLLLPHLLSARAGAGASAVNGSTG
jgi:hypothetical protein